MRSRRRRLSGDHRPRRHGRVLGPGAGTQTGRRRHIERANLLVGGARPALADAVAAAGVEDVVGRGLAGGAESDDLPVEATVTGAVRNRPRGEHHVRVEQSVRARVAVVCVAVLIPDDPRNRVVRARERDITLDSAAARVDVQRRVELTDSGTLNAVEPDLLEAEVADTRAVVRLGASRTRPGRRRDGMGDEDLRRAQWSRRVTRSQVLLPVELLPGEPRSGVSTSVRRAADQRWGSRVAVGVDVERRGRAPNLLALVDPLAATLSRSGLGQEPAREDLIVAEHGARLGPADPRDGPVGAGEVDRRGLRDLRGVLVERLGEALRLPGPALERPDEDLLAGAALLGERRPGTRALPAVTVPAVKSVSPASCAGSIAGRSLLTWTPGGRPTTAA